MSIRNIHIVVSLCSIALLIDGQLVSPLTEVVFVAPCLSSASLNVWTLKC